MRETHMEEQGLLADIREHPDDVSLRRIYADWLEDHGDAARAEFIRVQVELATTDEWDDARPELQRRERELLTAHRGAWLQGLPSGAVTFEGGLAQRWTLHAECFHTHAQAILTHSPLVALELAGLESDRLASAIAENPVLDQVQELRLSHSGLSGWNAIKLLRQRSLKGLRHLCLTQLRFSGVPLQELLRHPAALRLQRLDLVGCGLQGTDFEHLAQAATLGRLRFLDLSENALGGLEMAFLSSAQHWGELEHLGLRGGQMTSDGLRSLAQAPFLSCLHSLDLSRNPLGGHLGSFFAKPKRLPTQRLNLSRTRLNFDDLQHLVRSAFWPQMSVLNLSENELHLRDIQALVQADPSPPLRVVGLAAVQLDTPKARALAPWLSWQQVRELDLSGNLLDAHSLRALLFSAPLAALRSLDLSANPLGDLGARVLARWPGLPQLRRLVLASCQVSDEGAQALLAALPPDCPVQMELFDNPLSADLLALFRARELLAFDE